jgi:hypothetical protein
MVKNGYEYFNGSAKEYKRYMRNREIAKIRSNHQCTMCNMSEVEQHARYETDFHCHHIDHNTMNNSLRNLKIMCTGCHYDLHSFEGTPDHIYSTEV